MSMEIELRARFDQTKHDELLDYLRQHADDLGVNDKHSFFYVLPDKLLKVVENLSTCTAKISLKTSKIGQGAAFPEMEMEIPAEEVNTAVEIFNALGFADTMHDAYNKRHDFRYQGVEIAVKYSKAWGHHAEFELLLDDAASDADKAAAEARILQIADDLGVRVMTEEELAEFTAAFERSQAGASHTS